MADSRTHGGSSSAIVGLVLGVVGLLATVWIPTLAFLLGLAATALGYIGWRGSSPGRRSFATEAMVLGAVVLVVCAAVVLLTTGSSSGTSVTEMAP
jgi:cytochrome bd-type quinol oxidase subunit 1